MMPVMVIMAVVLVAEYGDGDGNSGSRGGSGGGNDDSNGGDDNARSGSSQRDVL